MAIAASDQVASDQVVEARRRTRLWLRIAKIFLKQVRVRLRAFACACARARKKIFFQQVLHSVLVCLRAQQPACMAILARCVLTM